MFQQAFSKLKQDNDDRQSFIRHIRDNPILTTQKDGYVVETVFGHDYCVTAVYFPEYIEFSEYTRSTTSIIDTWFKHYELHNQLLVKDIPPKVRRSPEGYYQRIIFNFHKHRVPSIYTLGNVIDCCIELDEVYREYEWNISIIGRKYEDRLHAAMRERNNMHSTIITNYISEEDRVLRKEPVVYRHMALDVLRKERDEALGREDKIYMDKFDVIHRMKTEELDPVYIEANIIMRETIPNKYGEYMSDLIYKCLNDWVL